MSRLQCVGTSSKVPSQDAEAAKPGSLSPRSAPVNKRVQPQKQLQKPKLSSQPAAQVPSAITERRHDKGQVDRITANPEPISKTQIAQQDSSSKKTKKVKHTHGPSRSETKSGLQAPFPEDTSTHRQEKSPRPSAPTNAEKKPSSSEYVSKTPNPQHPNPPSCGTDPSTYKAESEEDEDGSEEEFEDTDEFCAPIELLAEFLKAVMERKYTLAKKLCQMILIFEPDNPEAKHFLPLIEERLLIEEAQKSASCADNTSDDDNDDESDDDDDDDNDESSCGSDESGSHSDTESDEANSCSSSSSSDGEEEVIRLQ